MCSIPVATLIGPQAEYNNRGKEQSENSNEEHMKNLSASKDGKQRV